MFGGSLASYTLATNTLATGEDFKNIITGAFEGIGTGTGLITRQIVTAAFEGVGVGTGMFKRGTEWVIQGDSELAWSVQQDSDEDWVIQ